jgi:hypothetical protein
VRKVVNGRLATVMSDADGGFTSLKGAVNRNVDKSAVKSHNAHGMIFGGGRLDGKTWPHVLSAEDEKD